MSDAQHAAALAAAIVTRDHETCPHGSASSFAFDCVDCAAAAILDSTDPDVHAALLDALTRHGVVPKKPDPVAEPPRPKCDSCASGINSTCADCGCCNHEWDNDCGCDVKACGCYEARLDREAQIAENQP